MLGCADVYSSNKIIEKLHNLQHLVEYISIQFWDFWFTADGKHGVTTCIST